MPMFTVYKYEVELTDNPVVEMPQGAEILAIREVGGSLWACVAVALASARQQKGPA